ncbi:MAG: hypothetical protein OXC81_06305, partial [Betaproteobacteria bacterium]|nr:hypothetical protein [Betaproteobacteria bacterium]
MLHKPAAAPIKLRQSLVWVAGFIALSFPAAGNACDFLAEEFFRQATAAQVKKCLASGTAVNNPGESGWAPLHWAAANSQQPAVIAAL